MIIIFIYWAVAYHAMNYVWYSKKVYVTNNSLMFIVKKLGIAMFGGWIFIPWWIIAKLTGN